MGKLYENPVEIAKNTYWVGSYLENDPFQCHPYFIDLGENSILVDPGSMLEIEDIIRKIKLITDLKNINYIILHHQDPDLAAAVPYLEQLINRKDLQIVTHSRITFLIKHYGVKSQYYKIDYQNFELKINDYLLKFYTTPYCHSPGAFVTYDVQTKVLFSSDLFGGLEESWEFYAKDDYFKKIEGFHMAYMPSRDILNYALRKIENLDIELIAPQHGSIIQKPLIQELINKMKEMECGLYIEKKYSEDLTSTILKLKQLKREFETSLEEIKQLKRNQDGDYYLSFLLLKPLIVNKAKSEKFKIDFICIQKKSFLFKNKHYQIGGDICFANQIKIREKEYVLFFNGDAMGKSLQGANGAIVMGTILNSFTFRSFDYLETIEDVFQVIYNEIQNVFLSFDGSMMISGVLGILDEEKGKMYFINAEHPFVILYRDHKAEFIENELSLRKFGSYSEFSLHIKEFNFKENDVIFIGSDGKDDILLYNKNNQEKILNHDYKLFLRIIEKNEGKLKNIINHIYKISEQTDDISILRISFLEEGYNKNFHTMDSDEVYKLKIESYLKQKNFHKALELMEGPSETQTIDILVYRGYAFISMKRNLKALKYLLRAYKIQNDHPLVLKLLGIAYFNLKNYLLAKEHWERAIEIIPNDNFLKKNLKLVNRILKRQNILLGKKQGLENEKTDLDYETKFKELEKI